jgi:hypothetical protein
VYSGSRTRTCRLCAHLLTPGCIVTLCRHIMIVSSQDCITSVCKSSTVQHTSRRTLQQSSCE